MLHIFVIVPVRSGISCLMSHVGAGSNTQCFAGDAPSIFKISLAVTGQKPDRAVHRSSKNKLVDSLIKLINFK